MPLDTVAGQYRLRLVTVLPPFQIRKSRSAIVPKAARVLYIIAARLAKIQTINNYYNQLPEPYITDSD